MDQETEGFLSPYRVLDLTYQSAFLCGGILADLGAGVFDAGDLSQAEL